MQSDRVKRLAALEPGTTPDAAMALFDSLPATPLEAMLGSWRGNGIETGHPFDGVLEKLGWHGKRFDDNENVHPLVFAKPNGTLFSLNPSLIPLGLALRFARLFRHRLLAGLFRSVSGFLATRKPKARLRRTEFRGVVSATMIYDTLPISDVFRTVDADTLLGVMDLRGMKTPYVFVLRREV